MYQLTEDEFGEIATHFEWTNKSLEDVKEEKEFLYIDGKKYKIKKNNNKLTIGEIVSIETLIAQNKNLDPLEIAFGILLREVNVDGTEKEFNEDDFLHTISELQTKVMLIDIYNCISFFLSGEKNSTEISKGFSIKKKAKRKSPVE